MSKGQFFYDCKCGEAFDAAYQRCPACKEWIPSHAPRRFVRVDKATEHVCDSRCTNAVGHTCNCACGGKNHGRNAMRMAA